MLQDFHNTQAENNSSRPKNEYFWLQLKWCWDSLWYIFCLIQHWAGSNAYDYYDLLKVNDYYDPFPKSTIWPWSILQGHTSPPYHIISSMLCFLALGSLVYMWQHLKLSSVVIYCTSILKKILFSCPLGNFVDTIIFFLVLNNKEIWTAFYY